MAFDTADSDDVTPDKRSSLRTSIASIAANRTVTSSIRRGRELLTRAWPAIKRWWKGQPIPRFLAKSLGRRIITANVAGVIGLFLAMLYLSLHHSWLLDSKIDVIKTVSRITAEAIAYRAVNERAVFDADKLPEKSSFLPRRDDAFAALELPIEPHQVAVVLRKLIGPTDLIARVYSANGTLIVDSDTLFSFKTPADDEEEPSATATESDETPRLKNIWTRIHYWLINKELKVYRDIGTANGFQYPEIRKAAQRGKEQRMMLLNSSAQQIVLMAEPIKRGNQVLGVLVVTTRPGDIDKVLWDERWLIIQIAGIALLVSFGSGYLLTRTVAGPMTRLSRAAKTVSENLSARQQLPDFAERRDEVGQMGRAFAAMTRSLYRRIEASEKFAADVSHELKNPLAAARSTADALNYARTEEDRNHLVIEIQNELKRLNRLINDVSSTSRLDAELARQEMTELDIRDVVKNVADIFTDMLIDDKRKINIVVDELGLPKSHYLIRGNEGRLSQVFTNLIDNALSFSAPEGVITIRIKSGERNVCVTFDDQGPGIPEDKLHAIFDRFYSDRPETDAKRGKNSGLGLSISREIVASHNGRIEAENRHDDVGPNNEKPLGARFSVRLPRASKRA